MEQNWRKFGMKQVTTPNDGSMKPCPFCGSDQLWLTTLTMAGTSLANIECHSCGLVASFVGAEKDCDALKKWEERHAEIH